MENNLITALTFDDVLLKPQYSGFSRSDIDTSVQLTPKIKLKIPLISSPMDTVTESKLAISLAKLGGIGVVHRNLSIADQVTQVLKVKAKKLRVGAAVGSSPGYQERVAELLKAGADFILVDSAHGYAKYVIDAVKYIKQHHPETEVMAGSVATSEGAEALIAAGADSLRVGMGPGAICSTRIVSGMGMPQLTAIIKTAKIARKHGVSVVADGGINYSGDIVKALAAGATCVMMGRLFAATTEAPGESIELTAEEVPHRFKKILNGSKTYCFKTYRGMGSIGAMQKGMEISSEDEFHGKSYTKGDVLIAEGVEGMVPCSGSVADFVAQMMGGIHSGMYYVGAPTVEQLQETAEFVRITPASLNESHPHDLFITNPGENYQ
jgi:IMP dehydrogenase